MTQQQRKFLLDRLYTINRDIPTGWKYMETIPKPSAIKRAERTRAAAIKVIDTWQKNLLASSMKRDDLISAHRIEIKQIILFGNSEDAIKALDKFQNTKF